MFITLQELELHSVPFNVDIPAGQIDYDGKVTQSAALRSEGVAELIGHSMGEIRVHGNLDVQVGAPCDRCLEAVTFPVKNEFDLVYVPASEAAVGGEEKIDAAEVEVGYYERGGISIDDVLREVVLLALPMRLVCSEECKGICPVCGQNRNQRVCGCQTTAADDRWNQLKNIRVETSPRR
ncbi:MAG TPA: DUF177 domain-containing protein [Bryobacteraceae bacterium]|nr:DUF177 domain-containing protein [Bryobacteraceae bacterium]